jgi:RNA polymerase sigma-70 factor, ECF subfamily
MEDRLIDLAKAGDREALQALYERHAARVLAITRRLVEDDSLAEDLAQEAWIRAFKGLATYRSDARFSSWLYRVAVNTALRGRHQFRRRQARVIEMENVPPPSAPQPPPLLRLRLEDALGRLAPGMRRVLVLHDVEGYTHREIADFLGISEGTSKSQLYKARTRMREILHVERQTIAGEEVCST